MLMVLAIGIIGMMCVSGVSGTCTQALHVCLTLQQPLSPTEKCAPVVNLLGMADGSHVDLGGPYFLISRTLGVELGGAIGILLLLEHVVGRHDWRETATHVYVSAGWSSVLPLHPIRTCKHLFNPFDGKLTNFRFL